MWKFHAGLHHAKRELIAVVGGTQEFCVDIMGVREIRVWTPAAPVAHAPGFMVGVINLRGMVLPILDLAMRLGLPPTTPSSRHAILVAEAGAQVVGLLVEGVSEILTVDPEAIQPAPNVASRLGQRFVQGILALDGRLVSLLTLDAVVPRCRHRSHWRHDLSAISSVVRFACISRTSKRSF